MSAIERDIEQKIAELNAEHLRIKDEREKYIRALHAIRGECGQRHDEKPLYCTAPVGHVGKHSDGQWCWK